MDFNSFTPKVRSKSSVKIVNKPSIKKLDNGEIIEKELGKVQSYMKVYGHFPALKRFKSNRDSKNQYSPSLMPSTPNSKLIQIIPVPSNIEKNERSVQSSLGKTSEKEKITYEILKARSDKLEIARDLCTFELNFIENTNVHGTTKKLKNCAYSIVNLFSDYESYTEKMTDLLKNLGDIPGKCDFDSQKSKDFVNASEMLENVEKFSVKASRKKNVVEIFSGIYLISGENCLITVKSKFFITHHIKCLTPNGEILDLTIHKNLSDQMHKVNNYPKVVQDFILPYLYSVTSFDKIVLHFDETYGKSFASFNMKIKGAKNIATVIVKDFEDNLRIEIGNSNIFKIIDKFTVDVPDFSHQNQKILKRKIQKHLVFFHNTVVWTDDPFTIRENSSKFMKEAFLSDAFNDYLRKIFSLKITINGRGYKIDGYECQKVRHIKVISSKATITLGEDSKEYKILFSLQSLDFYKNQTTMTKSLELEFLLKILFNNS